MDALLVFPHQLFVSARKNTVCFFVEDRHFFVRDYPLHKHKIMLHRATMRTHFETLTGPKHYLNYPFKRQTLFKQLLAYDTVIAYDPIDHTIKKLYDDVVDVWLNSPNFMHTCDEIDHYFNKKNRYFMRDFYVSTRKKTNLLMADGLPIGNQFSFDKDNRKKLPNSIAIPPPLSFKDHPAVQEAATFCEHHFPNYPGSTETFDYPITKADALKQLDYFVTHKLNYFGPYQDALSTRDPFLFHAVISASLNIGLLNPEAVVKRIEETAAPIQSKEGFIRQIIGWREFIRAVYHREGARMVTQNVLKHERKLTAAWYNATTGIPFVDDVLQKVLNRAYAHHIERLMVLGNLMVLLNVHPAEVRRFFSAMFIDAYDWVMIPNVYGMSQFASGPLMTTKPYMSGSNYLKKMGIQDGPWAKYWDACFYRFLHEHRPLIENNPRLRMLLGHLDKKDAATLKHYAQLKAEWLQRLTIAP